VNEPERIDSGSNVFWDFMKEQGIHQSIKVQQDSQVSQKKRDLGHRPIGSRSCKLLWVLGLKMF
jgi:hypothetical protein